jgi:hypothetical protein
MNPAGYERFERRHRVRPLRERLERTANLITREPDHVLG